MRAILSGFLGWLHSTGPEAARNAANTVPPVGGASTSDSERVGVAMFVTNSLVPYCAESLEGNLARLIIIKQAEGLQDLILAEA